ncbi:hypothetical protein [Allorhodopirellula solitaria]|uniref:PEP-CTERM protein-sorting domain-containing protein n=1 Tax=Allorhodopirellula solitaria TaxID=2527987 RepID=A0A5C5X287_9BACT|nr:hypothetical protein [Allorhodopirellula solitaria]TWT56275.1 hypothetical protein CA85_44570 [Allorhodopirellula solitaria]
MKIIQFTLAILALTGATSRVYAGIMVDRSPDATGAKTIGYYENRFGEGGQYLGEYFSWEGGVLTGGSIFSAYWAGEVGDTVQFVVLPTVGPGVAPVVQSRTTIDAVDRLSTLNNDELTRKHASISPTYLPTGNYWFYMTGVDFDLVQAIGNWGDGYVAVGIDSNYDLEIGIADAGGDNFFQLEGNVVTVPEPTSLAIYGFIAFVAATGTVRRRIQKQ